MNWLRRLLHMQLDGEVIRRVDPPIDGYGVQADQEAIERTRAKQIEARQSLGLRWIGHPDARPTRARLDELHAEALVEHEQRKSDQRRQAMMRSALYDNVRRMR